jgi:SAM-dependent methyltransferase
MQRTPEPELMDDEAQARAYAEADFHEPHDRFVTLLRQRLAWLADEGTALDLGCGPGDVTLRFARAFPSWTVDGLDGSAAMLRLGRAAVEAAGLGNRVSLLQAHLPAPAAPRASYDLVFSNSLLHHLREPMVLWQAVERWTAPGAGVFVMDLLRPPDRDEAERLQRLYAAGEPPVLQHDFFHSLLAAYRPDEVRAQLAAAGLAHFDVEVVSDRHFIVSGRR